MSFMSCFLMAWLWPQAVIFVFQLVLSSAARIKHAFSTQPERRAPAWICQKAYAAQVGTQILGCPCDNLYNMLVSRCVGFTAYGGLVQYLQFQRRAQDRQQYCELLVQKCWNDEIDTTDTESISDVSLIFLQGMKGRSTDIALNIARYAVPSFWAGFSFRVGTRGVLDRFLVHLNKADELFSLNASTFMKIREPRDIEHAQHGIGQVMRSLNWDRKCHDSGHDSNLWVSLSKAYAQTALSEAKSIQRFVGGGFGFKEVKSQVIVVINHPLEKLRGAFLFKHELGLLGKFDLMQLYDFKNECSQQMLEEFALKVRAGVLDSDHIVSIRCDEPRGVGKESLGIDPPMAWTNVRTPNSIREDLAAFGSQIELLERQHREKSQK